MLLVTLTGLALAQETTPEPAWPTETPTLTPTVTFTDTPLPTATEAPLPTHTPPTSSPLPTETAIPTVEATVETTAETTAEITETPTSTPSPTATGTSTETPTVTATLTETATGTPLPPEPELRPVILGDFDTGYPGDWLLGAGWSWESVQNEGVLQLLNSPEAALLQWGGLLNVALSARFQVQSGGLRLSVRQSAAGSYSAVINSGGLLRLFRGEEELASAFVGAAAAGQWRTLRLSAMADVVRVALDGVEVLTVADLSPLPPGAMTRAGAGSSTLWIGDYRVERPLAELEAETRSVAALAFGSVAGQSNSPIVFTSSRDGDTEIFILDPAVCDGIVDCPATQLTFNAVVDSDPVLSPDGSQIAFTSLRDGNYELYLMNADGSGPVRLTSNSASDKDPTWSPDGRRIAFASNRTGHNEIYVINLDQCGTGADCPAAQLTASVNRSSEPAWHGNRIAYNSFEIGPSGEIWVMNEDGSGKQQLTNSNSIDAMPAWSPDGSEIAFLSNRYTLSNYDVVKLNYSQCTTPPNCPVTRLTTVAAYDYHPAWSPDGSEIAFTSDRNGFAQIYVMNADGTNQVRLTYTDANRDPQWWGPQCPTEGAIGALGAGGEYCIVPTPTPTLEPPEQCLGYPFNNDFVNVRQQPSIDSADIGDLTTNGRALLARWTVGTPQRWDDWYLVTEPLGSSGLGWARADVVYTSPRYGAACGLPVWDQPEAPANESIDLENLPPPMAPPSEPDGVFFEIQDMTLTDLRLPAPFTALPAPDTLYETNVYGMTTFAFWDTWSGQEYYDGTN
ncbi:MAG: PD40 domain-containing protein, partial [Anaerolineae bacterium]|nr:PD40 domain-containing protein [Anaerolineae bacterium]